MKRKLDAGGGSEMLVGLLTPDREVSNKVVSSKKSKKLSAKSETSRLTEQYLESAPTI